MSGRIQTGTRPRVSSADPCALLIRSTQSAMRAYCLARFARLAKGGKIRSFCPDGCAQDPIWVKTPRFLPFVTWWFASTLPTGGGDIRLVGLKQQSDSSWAVVENVSPRRRDLVPNLAKRWKGRSAAKRERNPKSSKRVSR